MQEIKQKKKIVRIVLLITIISLYFLICPINIYANQDEVLESQKESLNISDFIRKSRGIYQRYFYRYKL